MSTMSAGSVTPAALDGRRYFIVAELGIAGASVLAATDELEIPWAAKGITLSATHYLSRPIEVTLDAGWGKPENSPPKATLELPVSGRLADAIRTGAVSAGISCEVFFWIEGSDYSEREILVSGPVTLNQWGAEGEAVVLNVEQRSGEDGALVKLGIIDDTFSTLKGAYSVEDNLGRPYPVVFGKKQDVSAIRPDNARRSEAIPYARSTGSPTEIRRLIIAGHPVEATEVTVFDSEGNNDTLTITYRQDGEGRTFTEINILGSALAVAEGTTYSVRWSVDGGALVDRGQVVTGAGHLIEYLLRLSGLPVDFGRVAEARMSLDAYEVAGTIQEPVSALGYIGEALAPVLPFTLTSGAHGFYPWPWPINPKRAEAVAEFNPERGDITRSGELVLDAGSVLNDLVFSYAYDQHVGEMTRSTSGGAEDVDLPLGACINSKRAFGISSQSIENVVMENVGAVQRAIAARLLALAYPKARIPYDLSTSYGWLRPRQIVTVNDADVSAYGVAVVDSIELSEVGSRATVLILVPTGAP